MCDLCKNQLDLDVSRDRDRTGSYFVGLKIRSDNEDSPPLITGNTSVSINPSPPVSSINVVNKLWDMLMDKVKVVMDSVTDESIDSDGCDGSDGKIQKRTAHAPSQGACGRSKSSLNNHEGVSTEKQCNTKTSKKSQGNNSPSLLSPKESQSSSEQRVTDDELQLPTITEIQVGDRVTVDDCPGHWSWASPFRVEAIEGGMAKLDLVAELVEISRLSRVISSK